MEVSAERKAHWVFRARRRPSTAAAGEWVLVGIGVALDLARYAAKPAQSKYATAA
jgi:hypothetical protein